MDYSKEYAVNDEHIDVQEIMDGLYYPFFVDMHLLKKFWVSIWRMKQEKGLTRFFQSIQSASVEPERIITINNY